MKKKKILICVPIHRCPELRMLECMNETIADSKYQINYYWRVGDGLISRARNELSEYFLQSKYDYMMWIDDDIVWLLIEPFWN